MILNAFNLEGKVALITGCNTGLGVAWPSGWRRRAAILSA